jgi:imidazolonepropionase-like amidohydrolase
LPDPIHATEIILTETQSTLIVGATLIDGVADKPIEGRSLLIENGRIKAIGSPDELGMPAGAKVIDARAKYLIPGLMNANVHLFAAVTLERLARHMDHYEDIIAEAAQVALKSGLTTVFDTWGPRRHLMAVRDRINAGSTPGSRIFCAGNIIGFDGPLSPDFPAGAAVASGSLANRVNAIWVENVGRHLMWLTPEEVAREVRAYISKGIDFIKYASNEHGMHSAGAFLEFSPRVQELIVEEAHRAGVTAQAHCTSVEGLRLAVEAGCDLITHANITGPTPIPETTLDMFDRRRTGAVIFPLTQKRLDWLFADEPRGGMLGAALIHTMMRASDTNARKFIRSGAPLLLANDAGVFPPELGSDPATSQWIGADMDNYLDLSQGHFFWFKAMEEKECAPMEMLRAATRNIAVSYGKDKDLGTLEVGKIADVLILDRNPLEAAENYRSIHMILKDGVIVDRDALPLNPILTKPMEGPVEEEAVYKPALTAGRGMPLCPGCMRY